MNHKKIKTKPGKILISLFLALYFLFCPAKDAQAAAWPATDPAITEALAKIDRYIEGTLLSSLKQQAAQALVRQVNHLVGGLMGSSTMFITNWTDYLYTQPQTMANKYLNDYLSEMTGGRGSLTGYVSLNSSGASLTVNGNLNGVLGASDTRMRGQVLGDSTDVYLASEGFAGDGTENYAANLEANAKAATTEQTTPQLTYVDSPSKMFDSGNYFNQLGSYLSGVNNPWMFQAAAQTVYEKKMQQVQQEAFAQSIAYKGFTGTIKIGSDGQSYVTNPGSLVEQAVANVQDIGNKIIAAASHPEELIAAVVSQIATQAIQEGVGMVESEVSKQIDNVQSKYNEQLSKMSPQATIGR